MIKPAIGNEDPFCRKDPLLHRAQLDITSVLDQRSFGTNLLLHSNTVIPRSASTSLYSGILYVLPRKVRNAEKSAFPPGYYGYLFIYIFNSCYILLLVFLFSFLCSGCLLACKRRTQYCTAIDALTQLTLTCTDHRKALRWLAILPVC